MFISLPYFEVVYCFRLSLTFLSGSSYFLPIRIGLPISIREKIAAFIGLNFNLIVFLLHAMVGISDMNEENPRIIFEPLWMIKRELVWIPIFGYILFMAFYASIYLHLRHRESIKN